MLRLGTNPTALTVVLNQGADFVTGLDSLDGDWPTGAEIRIDFDGTEATSWSADIDGAAADWNVDKAEVDALIGRNPSVARLFYVDGGTDLPWAQGRVQIVTWTA